MKSAEATSALKLEAYASEFIGTYFLVLTIGLNVLQRTALGPVSVGLILMAMVFATGKVSGGHFNPAVTLGVLLCRRRHLHWRDGLLYVAAQLSGGLAAGCTYAAMLGATFTLQPGNGHSLLDALFAEVLFTVALVFVVLSVATTDEGNHYFGVAVGFTVMAAAFSVGSISGCSLNPAVAVGVIGSHWLQAGGSLGLLAPFALGPLLGSLVAAGLFRVVRAADVAAEEVPLPRSPLRPY